MYRIDVPTAVAVKPGYPAGGAGGFFANCNPGEGFPGTTLDAYFLNRVQEEICNVIIGAGIALNPAVDNQLFLAVQQLILGAVPLLPDFGIRPYVSASSNHTVDVDDEINGVIDFTTGGFWCQLPASTPNIGFPIAVIHSGASGEITVKPNGTDTVDGFAERKLRPGDRVDYISIGGQWRSLHGTYKFVSSEISFAYDTAFVFTHGLNEVPTNVRFWLKCVSPEYGYSAGDRILMEVGKFGETYGSTCEVNAANIRLVNQPTYTIIIRPKTAGGGNTNPYIDPAKWTIICEAEVKKG